MLHKSDTKDLFQETSPNPIKWAFLDEFPSNSCISLEKALKLTCPSVMRKWAFLLLQVWYSIVTTHADGLTTTSLYGLTEYRREMIMLSYVIVLFFCYILYHKYMPFKSWDISRSVKYHHGPNISCSNFSVFVQQSKQLQI